MFPRTQPGSDETIENYIFIIMTTHIPTIPQHLNQINSIACHLILSTTKLVLIKSEIFVWWTYNISCAWKHKVCRVRGQMMGGSLLLDLSKEFPNYEHSQDMANVNFSNRKKYIKLRNRKGVKNLFNTRYSTSVSMLGCWVARWGVDC